MPSSPFYHRDTCRMCSSSLLSQVIQLTPTPPGNDFLLEKELGREEIAYPLDLYFCENCHHVQLGHVVSPKVLYQKNYTYVSATSSQFVKHLKDYANEIIDYLNLKANSLVVDIGSNDGTCLSFFKEKKMKVVGVDPAVEIAKKASKNGIETVGDFFNFNLAEKLRIKYGLAKLITSHNACAHIDNLLDVFKGVEKWLDNDGVFVLEVGYLVDVYLNNWFDTIYHEHLDYHTVEPFEILFDTVGMEIIDVQRINPQGGSIRIIAQKIGGSFKRKSSVNKLISLEYSLGFNKKETFYAFEEKISLIKVRLQKLLNEIKESGKNIIGFGAPTKATTLMGYFEIDNKILDYIVDDNPLKQGLFTPINHIPVLPATSIYQDKPDYILILAWNFAESIMKMHQEYIDLGGQFILPMPTPQIVNHNHK